MACLRGYEERVRDLVRQGVDINGKGEAGLNGLIEATHAGHENIAVFLLSLPGIDVNVVDVIGHNALHEAAWKDRRQVVSVLLERSDVRTDAKDWRGKTARDLAVEQGNKQIVEMIEKREADSARKGSGNNQGNFRKVEKDFQTQSQLSEMREAGRGAYF